jgi:hypothetical protein
LSKNTAATCEAIARGGGGGWWCMRAKYGCENAHIHTLKRRVLTHQAAAAVSFKVVKSTQQKRKPKPRAAAAKLHG